MKTLAYILLGVVMLCAGWLPAVLGGVCALRIWHRRTGTPMLVLNLYALDKVIWVMLWITHSVLLVKW